MCYIRLFVIKRFLVFAFNKYALSGFRFVWNEEALGGCATSLFLVRYTVGKHFDPTFVGSRGGQWSARKCQPHRGGHICGVFD